MTRGPGPEGSFEAPSTSTPISSSSSISSRDFLRFHALAHDLLGYEVLEAHGLQLAPEQAEHGFRLAVPLLARDILHREPLKIDVGLDDVKERKLA